MATTDRIEDAFRIATQQYADMGVDVAAALQTLAAVPISLHCWQGDDVTGFESGQALTGGIAVTGNYPGKANTPPRVERD